ncbi:MAG TPA: hypothetical protein VEW46_08695 [Pyrinomonadaceae bacterium]|nr:hypothetical protein [Pyrinomonadaceae bacterium]
MRYLITFLVGLVVGGGAAIFLLGVPRAKSLPGTHVQAPAGEPSPSTVVVTLRDGFVSELLVTVFRDLSPPTFNLASTARDPELIPPANAVETDSVHFTNAAFQGGCTNSVTLAQESGNVKTQVQFANGNITAPLVFSGSYNLLGNCMQFKGWAQTSIQLSFDQASQTLYGRANVEGVNLEGVNPMANNFVTVFVRNAIDSRVNPLEILRPGQLQLMIPVKASNGSVKAQVKDVRSEAQDGQLRLHITYEFSGAKGQPQT